MTDYSPAALRDLKKQIAKKAIQRDLAENYEWWGDPDKYFQGGAWEDTLPPVTGPTGTIQIRYNTNAMSPSPGKIPPGARMNGGLRTDRQPPYYVYDIDPWTSIYQPWMEKIDSALQGWDALPDPSDYDAPLQKMRDSVTSLSPIPTDGPLNPSDFDSVDLESSLGLLNHWINNATQGADQGLLIIAFDSAYGYARVKGVLANQAQAGIVLGMTILGEQRVWQKTRADVMHLADEAVKAFDITDGGASLNFSLIHAFVDLVGDFVPGPIKTVLTVGSHALSLVEAVKPPEEAPDPHPDIKGSDVNSIYHSFCDAIGKLDNTLWNQEYELHMSCQGLLDHMREGKADQFDLGPGQGLDPDVVKAKALKVHPEYLKWIGFRTCPNIAAAMGKAAQDADAANVPGIWSRPSNIGFIYNGPYDTWHELYNQFDKVTEGSGKEMVEAGAALARGAGFLKDTDGYTQKALAGVQKEINRGKDSWDNTNVGVHDHYGEWIPN